MKTKVTFTWNLASEQPTSMILPVLASTQNNKLIVLNLNILQYSRVTTLQHYRHTVKGCKT